MPAGSCQRSRAERSLRHAPHPSPVQNTVSSLAFASPFAAETATWYLGCFAGAWPALTQCCGMQLSIQFDSIREQLWQLLPYLKSNFSKRGSVSGARRRSNAAQRRARAPAGAGVKTSGRALTVRGAAVFFNVHSLAPMLPSMLLPLDDTASSSEGI